MSISSDNTTDKPAFDLLHPKLQEQLYKMQWTRLRKIQVDSIREFAKGCKHIVISAQTASGKTEAAFLPILSKIASSNDSGVRALYIGPLKALINDQFRRLEDLCERASISVHKWHGDVDHASKKDLINNPTGVLLITPESIESLFVNHPNHLTSLFSRLSFVVIDEMHAFMGTERGAHLKSLLSRLIKKSSERVRIVGLSATLGDMGLACKWIYPRDPQEVQLIKDDDEKTVRMRLKGYLRSSPSAIVSVEQDSDNIVAQPNETESDLQLAEDVFRAFNGKTALIFANSRAKLEFYADLVRRKTERERVINRFRIHHGSLSKSEREETEMALRSDQSTATFCSSTLELGIDVGNISEVGQIGAPWSVSSLAQRIGRSGRKEGDSSVLWMYIEDDLPGLQTNIVRRLYPELIQAIAMLELMLTKWCEPPDVNRHHVSTLIQQIMSVIAEKGGAKADWLYVSLIENGAFTNVDKEEYSQILHCMGAADLIEQAPEGEIILGLKGESIVRSYDFYTAFMVADEFRVLHKGHSIGSVTAAPGLGADGFIILAGRRWRILHVDTDRHEILVEPSRGGRLPYFYSSGGADIHPKVRETMRSLLSSKEYPIYLDSKSQDMLATARKEAKECEIVTCPIYRDGNSVNWFTWTGSRINRTLFAIGRFIEGLNVRDEGIALIFDGIQEKDLKDAFRKYTSVDNMPSAVDLAMKFPVKAKEKYEWVMSEELQANNYARDHLDLMGASQFIVKNM